MFLPTLKVARQVAQPPSNGHFAMESDELNWVRCRETFANSFVQKTPGFFFSHSPNEGQSVASFIAKTEEIIECSIGQSISRCNFAQTNLNFALWVEPSEFWKSCEMRRSLFTIFLRCGLKYIPEANNYDEALNSEEYVRRTKDAIFRFLFGFVDYITDGSQISGIGKGWVTQFECKPLDHLRGRLVRSQSSDDVCLVGAGLLWE